MPALALVPTHPTAKAFLTGGSLEELMSKQSWTLIMALALVVGSARAVAQPAGAQAESLFRHGKELMTKGRFAEACAAFEASQKLDPTISTLLNLASCREKNGQLATAWGLFLEAERQTRTASDDPSRQLHQVAVNHATKLEPRLSTLTITVAPEHRVGGLQVHRNADLVDPGAWNKALPIDGGTYKITASAPGNADWSAMITLGNERDAKTIDIPRLKAAALGEASTATSATSPAAPQPVGREPGALRSKIVPIALGGAALALAGGAVGFELSARSTYDKAEVEVDDARQRSLWSSAKTRRYVAQGLGVASLASAGVAVWLYLRADNDEASPVREARVQVMPAVDGNRAGLVVMGRY
jgi:hypothetical protein